jgi:hypothetical protein
MDPAPRPHLPLSDAHAFGAACRAHLEREEGQLVETLTALQHARAALLLGSGLALSEALAWQARAAELGDEAAPQRESFRADLAATLGVAPGAARLSLLLPHLSSEDAAHLSAKQERLQRLAGEVEQVNQGNAALIRYALGFLHRLFNGTAPGGDRYDPAGKRHESAWGAFVEARG